jgi:hypothetical protein
VIIVLAGTAACGDPLDPRPRARDNAAKTARAGAAAAQHDLSLILGEAQSGDQQPAALSDRIRSTLQTYGGGGARGQLLDLAVDPDRNVRAGMAFFAQGEAGGGLSAETVTVRLCVSLRGAPEPPATVDLTDESCPTGMLPSGRYLDGADETIKLTD